MTANWLALAVIAIRASSMILGALVTIMIARVSGTESVGYFALLVLFASFSVVPVKGAVASILFRQLARVRGPTELEQAISLLKFSYRCLAYTAPIALVFTALLLLRLDPPASEPIRLVAATVFVIMTFEGWASIQLSALRGAGRSLFAQLLDGVLRPLCILFGVVAAMVMWGQAAPLASLCIGYLAGLFATRAAGSIVLRSAALRDPIPTMRISEFFALHGKQASFFLGSSFTATAIANFDIAVGGLLLSVEQLGSYKIVLQLCVVANALYIGLNFHIARDFAAYQPEELKQSPRRRKLEARGRYFAWLCVLFASAVTAATCVVGKPLAEFVFDVSLEAEWYLFLIVGASFVANGAFGMANSFLMMNHDERFVFMWSTLVVVTCVPLSYLSVMVFGVYGAASALFMITLLWNLGLAWRCSRKFSFNPTVVKFRRYND